MKRPITLSIATFAAGFVAQPAAAADFILDVPVRIANMPSVTDISVLCVISRVELDGLYPASTANRLGDSSVTVPITGGNFDGIVTVEVNNSSIGPSTDARSYICNLRANGTSRTGVRYSASPSGFRESYERATGATLDGLRTTVRGNLP